MKNVFLICVAIFYSLCFANANNVVKTDNLVYCFENINDLKDELRKEANSTDTKDSRFTKAGRSLTKHGSGKRVGNSLIPAPKGNPDSINNQAAELVDDILENGKITTRTTGRGVNIVQVAKENGVGMVFQDLGNGNYSFKYFGENLY